MLKPAAWIASSAVVGLPGAQPDSMPRPKCVKSTITVTPDCAVHAVALAAPARAAGAATAKIAIAAPMAAGRNERTCMLTSSSIDLRLDQRWVDQRSAINAPCQHGFNGSIADAVEDPIGSFLPAIAGTACTVAKTFAVVLPGKKNAPRSGLVQPIWKLCNAVYGEFAPFFHRLRFGELCSATSAWITNAVELGSGA